MHIASISETLRSITTILPLISGLFSNTQMRATKTYGNWRISRPHLTTMITDKPSLQNRSKAAKNRPSLTTFVCIVNFTISPSLLASRTLIAQQCPCPNSPITPFLAWKIHINDQIKKISILVESIRCFLPLSIIYSANFRTRPEVRRLLKMKRTNLNFSSRLFQ